MNQPTPERKLCGNAEKGFERIKRIVKNQPTPECSTCHNKTIDRITTCPNECHQPTPEIIHPLKVNFYKKGGEPIHFKHPKSMEQKIKTTPSSSNQSSVLNQNSQQIPNQPTPEKEEASQEKSDIHSISLVAFESKVYATETGMVYVVLPNGKTIIIKNND